MQMYEYEAKMPNQFALKVEILLDFFVAFEQ